MDPHSVPAGITGSIRPWGSPALKDLRQQRCCAVHGFWKSKASVCFCTTGNTVPWAPGRLQLL